MANVRIPTDLHMVMARALLPTVTQWNRVEGRPRTAKFDRSMRAEVRDALWMFTRQWQLGEFRGDDAGSPMLTQMRVDYTKLTKAKFGEDAILSIVDDLPIETRVERMRVAMLRDKRNISLDLRLLLGRQWLSSIAGIGPYADKYRQRYPIAQPDPDVAENADICAHPGVFAMISALAGRAMDGGALYLHLLESGTHAWDDVVVAEADKQALDTAGLALVSWFDRLISQPPPQHDGAWTPDRMEYQFDCSAPVDDDKAKVYAATEYAGGQLDWWALDTDRARTSLEDATPEDTAVIGAQMRTTIPTQLQFDGMPNPRWWTFEDGKVNLGQVSASTTDLTKLLFLEFGLVYSNDWFLTPFTAPAGTVITLSGCAVTNNFNERCWITPAGAGDDDDPQRFTLFTSSVLGDDRRPADTSLLLLPTAPSVIDGPVREEVLLLRDEMANMVWAVERQVTLPDGSTRPGIDVGYETRAFYERITAAVDNDPPFAADQRYRVMTTVPEHWIPFIPARTPDGDRTIRLQRAKMQRLIEGLPDEAKRVAPLTSLLRDGLDDTPRQPYFLQEDEVPREGARVVTQFQRTRWRDGRVLVWLGARKTVGRGEGASGLEFDRLIDTRPTDKP
jgi:hypothetical protein